jgi:TonB family protein
VAGGGSDNDDDGINGINVTPLVDVTLVLLIIFMVTATYIVKETIEVELPRAAPETVKPYKAARYATSAQVNELPGVLNRDALDIKRYYPPAALKKEFEGDVVLRLLIDSDGTIAKVDVVNDPGEGLGAAAARAVRQLRFSPGKVDGEAVATTIPFTIRFVIN